MILVLMEGVMAPWNSIRLPLKNGSILLATLTCDLGDHSRLLVEKVSLLLIIKCFF
jgi:hypothetical protein